MFAGLGTFAATGNPALGFSVGIKVAWIAETIDSLAHGRVPGSDLFGGTFGSGSLTGCGGPLGSCGTFGTGPVGPGSGDGGPWSEELPSNGFNPALAGAGGAGGWILGGGMAGLCVGSGVCEAVAIGGAVVAVVGGAIYIGHELGTWRPQAIESRGGGNRGSGQSKGERNTAAKPEGTDNPGKHVRVSKTHPGRYEAKNPRTGKWTLKPPTWKP